MLASFTPSMSCIALVSVLLYGLVCLGDATQRPIIGVLSQELDTPGWRNYCSYIPAQYVKAVEAAGARVVPVFMGQSLKYYRNVTSFLNGLVIPGGSADPDAPAGIGAALAILYNLAKQVYDKGGYFPILGVCQGMELLAWASAKRNADILTPCKCEKRNLPLNFKPWFRNSSLYSETYKEDIRILSELPVTSNHHLKCVTESSLVKMNLNGTWRVLSTNKDDHGVEFVSSMEDSRYPFAGVQFHPEKNAFEWDPRQENPHGRKAVRSNRMFYDWLVREGTRSPASFPDLQQETDSLIYNYNPIYVGPLGLDETQGYFFYDPNKQKC